jgi:hypothetical protein
VRSLHATFALAAYAAAATLIFAGVIAQVRPSRRLIQLTLITRRVLLTATGGAVGVGLLLLAAGQRPKESLHFLYAAVALAAVPIAARFAAREPRRGGLYHAAAGLVLLGVLYRLTTTG